MRSRTLVSAEGSPSWRAPASESVSLRATYRNHLTPKDGAFAGGGAISGRLKRDEATVLAVVAEPRKLRDARNEEHARIAH